MGCFTAHGYRSGTPPSERIGVRGRRVVRWSLVSPIFRRHRRHTTRGFPITFMEILISKNVAFSCTGEIWHDWHDVTAQITRFGSSRNQFFQQPIRVESCWITTVSGWSCAPVRLIHPAPETEGLHPRLHDVSHRCREKMWSDCGLVGDRSMAVTIWGCEHELCWKRGCQEGDLPLARHVFVS